MNVFHWVMGGMFFLGGAVIYAMRIPERFWPGRFDLAGISHNIWHIMVFIGAIYLFFGSLNAYHSRRMSPCPALLKIRE